MIHAIADTHAVIWYLLGSPHLSATARAQFDIARKNRMRVGISAISIVEIIYLIEKGRIRSEALSLLKKKLGQKKRVLEIIPMTYEIAQEVQNVPYDQVPDFPDRIIAATASYHTVPLISRDRDIQTSSVETIW